MDFFPIRVKNIGQLSKTGILILKGKFPEGDYQPPEELLKILTAAEKDSMAKNGNTSTLKRFVKLLMLDSKVIML